MAKPDVLSQETPAAILNSVVILLKRWFFSKINALPNNTLHDYIIL